jgi:hypothetical protein
VTRGRRDRFLRPYSRVSRPKIVSTIGGKISRCGIKVSALTNANIFFVEKPTRKDHLNYQGQKGGYFQYSGNIGRELGSVSP